MTSLISTRKKGTMVFSYVCAALSLVMIITQFLPYWNCFECKTCGDLATISINEYVWFPTSHKAGLTTTLTNLIPGFRPMDVAASCAFMQVASALCIVFAALKPKKLFASVFCMAGGIIGLFGYLTVSAYSWSTMWLIFVIINSCAILAGLGSLIWCFAFAYKKAKTELAAFQAQ